MSTHVTSFSNITLSAIAIDIPVSVSVSVNAADSFTFTGGASVSQSHTEPSSPLGSPLGSLQGSPHGSRQESRQSSQQVTPAMSHHGSRLGSRQGSANGAAAAAATSDMMLADGSVGGGSTASNASHSPTGTPVTFHIVCVGDVGHLRPPNAGTTYMYYCLTGENRRISNPKNSCPLHLDAMDDLSYSYRPCRKHQYKPRHRHSHYRDASTLPSSGCARGSCSGRCI